jgi:hypothetical protein
MKYRLALTVLVIVALASCSSSGSSDSGGPKLALGTAAVVPYTASANGTIPAAATTLSATITAVRKGSQDDLVKAGITVDAKEKESTPYYVDATFVNQGTGSISAYIPLDLEDTKGNSAPETFVIGGGLDTCPGAPSGSLAPGAKETTCTLFLAPKGTTLSRVRLVSTSPDGTITFTDWDVK